MSIDLSLEWNTSHFFKLHQCISYSRNQKRVTISSVKTSGDRFFFEITLKNRSTWSLLGVLRTFSQLLRPTNPNLLKSTWGFENLFPTVSCHFQNWCEVYLGFWEPFPNARQWILWWREVYLGFWEPFPNGMLSYVLRTRSLLGVLRTFSQLTDVVPALIVKSTWGFENLFPTVCRDYLFRWEVYLGFWEPFPNHKQV